MGQHLSKKLSIFFIVVYALLLVLSYSFVSAQSKNKSQANNFSGLYLLAGLGSHSLQQSTSGSFVYPWNPQYFDLKNNITNLYSKLGFGYGWDLDKFYIGLQTSYNHTYSNGSNGNAVTGRGTLLYGTTYSTFKNNSQIEATMLFGRIIRDKFLLYLKTGYLGAWASNTISYNSGATSPFDVEDPGFSSKQNNFMQAYVLSGGVRVLIWKRVAADFSYEYVNYFKRKYNMQVRALPSNMSTPPEPIPYSITDNVYSNNFIISLIYML